MRLRPFPADAVQKSCSVCRAAFTCGSEVGRNTCWCDDLPPASFASREDQGCLCSTCLAEAISNPKPTQPGTENTGPCLTPAEASQPSLVEGVDYYWEGAAMVFTAVYHRRRGFCCESECRHCPY